MEKKTRLKSNELSFYFSFLSLYTKDKRGLAASISLLNFG